jgi:hypothetical protein
MVQDLNPKPRDNATVNAVSTAGSSNPAITAIANFGGGNSATLTQIAI